MSIENPLDSLKANPQESRNSYGQKVEQSRSRATELQRNVEAIQSAKYGDALLRLMERTGNNPEITNGLNQLLDALDRQSRYGESDKPIVSSRQKDLVEFLGEVTKALSSTVGGGNRPADVKIDLSKWELGK